MRCRAWTVNPQPGHALQGLLPTILCILPEEKVTEGFCRGPFRGTCKSPYEDLRERIYLHLEMTQGPDFSGCFDVPVRNYFLLECQIARWSNVQSCPVVPPTTHANYWVSIVSHQQSTPWLWQVPCTKLGSSINDDYLSSLDLDSRCYVYRPIFWVSDR